jgi:Fe-S cluster assembly protein SufD
MKTESKNIEIYLTAYEKFKSRLNGELEHPFTHMRDDAILAFKKNGFPSTRDEDWRFTNLSPLLDKEYMQISDFEDYAIDADAINKLIPNSWQGHLLVFVDGVYSEAFSQSQDLEKNLTITSLSKMMQNKDSDVFKLIPATKPQASDVFANLNTAFTKDGLVVHIPDNTEVTKPVIAIYVSSKQSGPHICYPRNYVIVGENSKVDLVQYYTSTQQNIYFNNVFTELIAGSNAKITLDVIQNESLNAYHVSNMVIHQSNDSNFKTSSAIFGGRLVRNNISSILDGTGVETTLNGLYMGHQQQHIDNFTFLDHAKPHCDSHELYRGILDNHAKGVFSGKILVRPDAQKTDAKQSNNCILLSDSAKIDSKPQLEIYADDVKCTHGATVGQLDDDALFYLRTRGISLERAQNLLIYAFAEEIIEGIKLESVRALVENLLEQRMEEDIHFIK